MPNVSPSNEPQKFELKSAPPDGFILVRELSAGEVVHRQELALRFSLEQAGKNADSHTRMELMHRATRTFELEHQIVDHNLENQMGQKLDFGKADRALSQMSGKVWMEIQDILDKFNNPSEDDEKNSESPSVSSLSRTAQDSDPTSSLKAVTPAQQSG